LPSAEGAGDEFLVTRLIVITSPNRCQQTNVTRFFHFGNLPIKISDYASDVSYNWAIPFNYMQATRLRPITEDKFTTLSILKLICYGMFNSILQVKSQVCLSKVNKALVKGRSERFLQCSLNNRERTHKWHLHKLQLFKIVILELVCFEKNCPLNILFLVF